jgi:hypothetical protein
MAFMLSSFMAFFSSCLAGFTVDPFLPIISCFASGGELAITQPVTVSKNRENTTVVTMDIRPPLIMAFLAYQQDTTTLLSMGYNEVVVMVVHTRWCTDLKRYGHHETRRCLIDLFDKSRREMEAEVKKSFKWVVLTALFGFVLLTLYVMVK